MNAAFTRPLLGMLLLVGAVHAEEKKVRNDIHGDALPDGAVARLGSGRWRHGDPVTFVAQLPGGKTMITADTSWDIRVWDIATGKELRRFTHSEEGEGMPRVMRSRGQPLFVSISDDGKTLVSGINSGRRVCVWDVSTGKLKGKALTVEQYINNLALSHDGKTVAVNSADSSVRLLDLDGKELKRLAVPDAMGGVRFFGGGGTGLRFSPDGKMLVQLGMELDNGSIKRALKIFDTQTGKELHRIEPDGRRTLYGAFPAFSPDGKLLALASQQGEIQLVNPVNGKEVRTIKTNIQLLEGVTFTPDGKSLVGRGISDERIGMWNVESGKEEKMIGKVADNALMVRRRFYTPYGMTGTLSLSEDGKKLAATDGNLVRLIDLATGKDLITTVGHRSSISGVRFAQDGKSLMTQGLDGSVRLWDSTGKETGQVKVPTTAYSYTMSLDGKLLLMQANTGQMQIVEAATGKVMKALEQAEGVRVFYGYAAAGFSPDGKVVVVRSISETTLRMHSVETGKLLATLGKQREDAQLGRIYNRATALAFSADSKMVASLNSDNNAVAIWEVPSGNVLREIILPAEVRVNPSGIAMVVRDLSFSRDGRTLMVDLGDNRVIVYEVTTGSERKQYYPKNAPPQNVQPNFINYSSLSMYTNKPLAVTADGRRMAMACVNHLIHIWDMATGEELAAFKGHQGEITAIDFSPDGKQLVSSSEDATGLIWDVSTLKTSKPLAAKLDEATLKSHLNDLLGADGKRASTAVWSLAAAAEQAVEYLEKNLKPSEQLDLAKVTKLIADLDARRFVVRKKAQEELEKLGGAAAPAMKKALSAKPSEELRKRLEELLDRVRNRNLSSTQLQTVRAIEALEKAGTSSAKSLLEKLSKGAEGALETVEARDALSRLGR